MDTPIVNIVGEKVALGPHRRESLPAYQRWFNDFETLRGLLIAPRPLTMEGETAWYESVATSERVVSFAIYERETWRPIGTTAWGDIDHRHRSATFGITIGEPDARGKGYGTEATRLMLDYAFTALGLHNCLLTVYAYNIAAHRAYTKAGFRECGRRRECHWFAGKLWDEVYMDCLATEFVSPVLAEVLTPDEPR